MLMGDTMTISLPGPSKFGFGALLGKKRSEEPKASDVAKPLKAHEIAKRFSKTAQTPAARPAKLNDAEKQDRARLSSLRGALYSED